MLREGLRLKSYCPISLFSGIITIFEKLVNNRLNDYGFRSSCSTVNLIKLCLIELLGFLIGLQLLEL